MTKPTNENMGTASARLFRSATCADDRPCAYFLPVQPKRMRPNDIVGDTDDVR